MTKVYSKRLRQLKLELTTRYDRLIYCLNGDEGVYLGHDTIDIDQLKLRLAINDFNTILKELKKI